jgi:hypothetical protein
MMDSRSCQTADASPAKPGGPPTVGQAGQLLSPGMHVGAIGVVRTKRVCQQVHYGSEGAAQYVSIQN